MSDSIILIITTIFTQFIIFLACTFSPYLSMHGIFFGVRLDDQHKKSAAVKRVTKSYLFQCSGAFILSLIITIWLMLTSNSEKQVAFIMILSIFLLMGLCFAFFVKAYHQIKSFAHTLESTLAESTKKIIDTSLMKEKAKLKKHFRLLYLIPLLFVILLAAYTLINYPTLPDQIPTHWNLLGKADKWQPKSPMNVFMHSFMQFILLGILFYVSDQTFIIRGKLDPGNYESSKREFMRYLKGMSYSLYVMTLSINLTFMLITFSMVKGTSLSSILMLLCMIAPFLAVIYMFIIWFKYRKHNTSHTDYSPENEDDHWVWGSFYYNPNDPSVFVEKRYGIGLTINLATPLGKGIMIATVVILIVSIFLPLIIS